MGPIAMDEKSYEAGYREGENSRAADLKIMQEQLGNAAKEIRERCAKIAEGYAARQTGKFHQSRRNAALEIAALIRNGE
jgi:hypothetical protein